MNRVFIAGIVIFLALAIVVGLVAILKDTNFNPQKKAASDCPPQELPENKLCPQGLHFQLTEDTNGCFIFTCQ